MFMKLSLGCAVVLAPLWTTVVYADVDKNQMAQCAAISNTINRLECYDNLAKAEGLVSTNTSRQVQQSNWRTNTKTDPLTDESVYTAILVADEGKAGPYRDDVALVVRCQDNKTEMYIVWDAYLGRDSISTTYRIGKNPATTSSWSTSTDNKAAFFPGSPIGTLKQLIDSEDPTFVANVTPYNANPVTAIFNTTGSDQALLDIRNGCSW